MAKTSGKDWVDFTETGNWNIAADYVKLCVMKPMYETDEYERIATFGANEISDYIISDKEYSGILRYTAIEWLIHSLITIIDNTIFAVKVRNGDKEKLRKTRDELESILVVLPKLKIERRSKDGKKMKVEIHEEQFRKCLQLLRKMKAEIKEPLNRADLIFTSRDEVDPSKLKEQIIQRLSTTG